MPDILDIFNQDAFGVISLTQAVNDTPPTFGKINALGLFTSEPLSNRFAAIDFDPTTVSLLPQTQWGAPGTPNKNDRPYMKVYSIPHFLVNDSVLAADLQSRRRPGSLAVEDAQYVLGRKQLRMRTNLEQTLEWMRLGVLRGGLVKDGAGNTILDIYGDFSLTQDSTSFVLGTPTTDIVGKIAARKRAIESYLRGESMGRLVALCSDGFYDAFVSHAMVKEVFRYYSINSQNNQGDYRDGFVFNGVTWINYSGSFTDSTGASQACIDTNAAYLFPMGTSVFKTFYAPADYTEMVNMVAQEYYSRQELMKMGKGIEIEVQSNPLPICLKPKVIQKLTVA